MKLRLQKRIANDDIIFLAVLGPSNERAKAHWNKNMSNNRPLCNNDMHLRTSWVRITAPTSAAFERACRVTVSRGRDGMMEKNGKCTVIDNDRNWFVVVFRVILVRGQLLQDHWMW